ncbi:MAG: hydrogenase iron-sulfur subunit [Desulfobacteraceae bacterium]|nr:hydrogenase iron-sulfur subunit [Desulfobacteraceae bacterium]
MGEYEPTIIAFVCNWCTYTAADLAGTSRLIQAPNMRMIRMMCTGMVDPKYVIKALLEGADGVLVSGCHPGDCHYINGNLKARRRIKLLQQILPKVGFDERRLKMTWIGASEGIDFAATVGAFVSQVKSIGPNALRSQMVL